MKTKQNDDKDVTGRKIRIAHVVFNLGTGGVELGLRRLILGLDPDRYEQIVVPVMRGVEVPGARVVALNREPTGYKFLVGQFAKLFRQLKPDIVHSRNWPTLEAVPGAWLAGVPAILHCEHGRNANDAQGEPLRQRVMRYVYYSMADRVLTVSEDLKQYLHKTVHVPEKRLQLISDGVDTNEFRADAEARARIRHSFQIADDAFVLGTVARFDPVKDLRVLLRAAEIIVRRGVNAHVMMVGYGPLRETLERESQALPVLQGRVHFSGETKEVVQWLSTMDAFVLTSLFEGTSVALLEAMSVGVPPVVTRVGGNPEVVSDERYGYLIETKDEMGLAVRLEGLAANRELREQIGRACRQRIQERYELNDLFRRYEQVYLEMLGRREQLSTATLARAAATRSDS